MGDACTPSSRRVLVVVPAWNEEGSVAEVVTTVRRHAPDADILVVDDASSDDTTARAQAAGADVLRVPINLGVGGAMRAGFRWAHRHDYDVVVQVDADGQHPADRVADLVSATDEASVVIGARFAGAGDYQVRGPRRWAMRLLARALSRVSRTQLTDVTSGFRAADRTAVALFAKHYPAEYLGDTVESLVLSARSGLRITQIPVTMSPRLAGQPSQSAVRAALYLARAGIALLLALIRQPLPLPSAPPSAEPAQ